MRLSLPANSGSRRIAQVGAWLLVEMQKQPLTKKPLTSLPGVEIAKS